MPTNVAALPGNSPTATITFTVPASNGSPITTLWVGAYSGSTLEGLDIVTTGLVQTAGATQTVVYALTGSAQLKNGTNYTFEVVEFNANGASPVSAPSNVIDEGAPLPPTNVIALPGNSPTATITFTVPANNGSPITTLWVGAYSGSTLEGLDIVTTGLVQTAGATQTVVYALTGSAQLKNGTNYTFKALEFNANGASPVSVQSNPIVEGAVAPAQPADVLASPGNASATVSFAELPYSGPALTSYEVEVLAGASLVGTQNVSANLGLTGTSTAMETTTIGPGAGGPALIDGDTYAFDVVAFNADGASPLSAAALTIVPNSPTWQTTSSITPSSAYPATAPSAATYLAGLIEAAQVPSSYPPSEGGGAIGENGRATIQPDMAGYAAAGLAAYGGATDSPAAETDVLSFLNWYAYAETLNTNFIVYNWQQSGSTWATTSTVDSVDTPPSMFLLAADNYWAAMTAIGQQATALANLSTPSLFTGLQDALQLLLNDRDAADLTEAYPPGYQTALLEDNSEAYGGLTAAGHVFDDIGTSAAKLYGYAASLAAGDLYTTVQNDMWDASAGGFYWAYPSTTGTGPCTPSTCNAPVLTNPPAGNPSIQENLWAVAWGLATPAETTTIMSDPGVANVVGSFADPLVNATPPTTIVNGLNNYPNGGVVYYAGAGLWALQDDGGAAAANTDLIADTDFGSFQNDAWPLDNGTVGEFLIAADAGGKPVPSD
ncbi:MAG: fibronectin type III domain-containing protein [Acidimicrobiales bacterium]